MNIELNLSGFERKDSNLVMRNQDRVAYSAIFVTSHHTGRVVQFRPIGEDHPMFDHDCWDGEMALYEPVEQCNVNVLVMTR